MIPQHKEKFSHFERRQYLNARPRPPQTIVAILTKNTASKVKVQSPMSIQEFKCSTLKNEKVKSTHLPVPEVPEGLFKLHTLAAFIGCRGSGKTNAAVLLARRYLDEGIFNRIFIISPTYESNPQFATLRPDPSDVYQSIDNAVSDLNDILEKVRQDVEDHEKREEYKAVYRRYLMGKATIFDMNILEANHYRKPVILPKPCPLLIIDDMSHSPLYTPSQKNGFINLCLRHRHLHRVGITIYMLVQNFKTGIPKCLRQNVQQYFLWPTHDMSQLDSMYEEFANICTKEQFYAVYRRATAEKHAFLTVDLNAPSEEMKFRKNFDTALVVPTSENNIENPRKKRAKTIHDSGPDRPVGSGGDMESVQLP
jgi:hypothetical protein